jgi:hypothetical protein
VESRVTDITPPSRADQGQATWDPWNAHPNIGECSSSAMSSGARVNAAMSTGVQGRSRPVGLLLRWIDPADCQGDRRSDNSLRASGSTKLPSTRAIQRG